MENYQKIEKVGEGDVLALVALTLYCSLRPDAL
jgi:hypothetical protein